MLLGLAIVFVLALPFAYDSSAMFRYYARFYVYYSYVMVAAVFMIPFMACRSKNVENLLWASRVCRLVSRLIGLRWTVHGAQRLRSCPPCVIVANHQSSLDILGMFEIWHDVGRMTVVAKRELMFAGPFGLAAWLCGLIFIDRADPSAARNRINQAVQLLKSTNTKLWVFPEGTRRSTGVIHPFKRGAFHMAVAQQLPIQPIVFSHYYFLDSPLTTFEPGEIVMTILPPIETTGLTERDVDDLIEKTHLKMLNTFNSLLHIPKDSAPCDAAIKVSM